MSIRVAILFLGVCTSLAANRSAYQRAQALAESDPREAEAIYVSVLKSGFDTKIKRAAAHELFTLRLKQKRIAEAFSQAHSKAFSRRLISVSEEALHLSPRKTAKLFAALRGHCSADGDAREIGEMLEVENYNVAAYNLAVKILKICGAQDLGAIFVEGNYAERHFDSRSVNLELLRIREMLEDENFDEAERRLHDLRFRSEEAEAAHEGLEYQLSIAQILFNFKKANYPEVVEDCDRLEEVNAKHAMFAFCRFLCAFSLSNLGRFDEAYAKIKAIQIPPAQIDNRLLRLLLEVRLGKKPRANLIRFQKRKSYSENASSIRELADATLVED